MTYRELRSKEIVILGRDWSDDVAGVVVEIGYAITALLAAFAISLKTEDNLYSNVLVLVTIMGLVIRTFKGLTDAYFKRTESQELKEQREATQKAIEEEREERERAERLMAEVEEREAKLADETQKLAVQQNSLKLAKELIRSERKE